MDENYVSLEKYVYIICISPVHVTVNNSRYIEIYISSFSFVYSFYGKSDIFRLKKLMSFIFCSMASGLLI